MIFTKFDQVHVPVVLECGILPTALQYLHEDVLVCILLSLIKEDNTDSLFLS